MLRKRINAVDLAAVVALAAITWATLSAGTALADNLLLQDDFSGTSLNPLNWTAVGSSVSVANGAATVAQDQTDAGGNLDSRPLTFAPTGLITISDRIYVHHANDYFFGGTALAGASWQFGASHIYTKWYNPSDPQQWPLGAGYQSTPWDAFAFGSNEVFGRYGGSNMGQVPSVWDAWVNETITLDPISGICTYSLNGGPAITGTLSTPLPQSPLKLVYNSYGWFTGHYVKIDSVSVTQAAATPPNYQQAQGTPGSWGGDKLLDTTTTMHAQGCFVSSVAMILDCFGHKDDPGQLNAFLLGEITAGKIQHTNGGAFPWDAFKGQYTSYGPGDGTAGLPLRCTTTSVPTAGSGTIAQEVVAGLQQVIDAHGPVLLRVPWKTYGASSTSAHAIVAYDVTSDGSVMVRDPGSNYSGGTLALYVAWINDNLGPSGVAVPTDYSWLTKTNLTYFTPESQSSPRTLAGHANSPVEFVVTDNLGRRLGYDPVTRISYNEIPGSTYFRESFPADADGGTDASGYAPLYFEIGDPVAGDLHFDVYGVDAGEYSINFGVDDPTVGYNPQQYSFGGTAAAGSLDSADFSVTIPEPASLGLLALGAVGVLSRRTRRH